MVGGNNFGEVEIIYSSEFIEDELSFINFQLMKKG